MGSKENVVKLDASARSHWLGVVALLEKKPETKSGGGGMSLAALFGGNIPSNSVLDGMNAEEEEIQLFHKGCDHMRCRHDPQRSLRARIADRRRRRVLKMALNLHMQQRAASAHDIARL